MLCPKCQSSSLRVLDSRDTNAKKSIRRRRKCNDCGYRFSTIEEVKILDLYIEKRNGRIVPFDEKKLELGVRNAFNKREVREEKIQKIVQEVIDEILSIDKSPLKSTRIGKAVLKILKQYDEAAYICYWAMYGNFTTAEDFNNLLTEFDG